MIPRLEHPFDQLPEEAKAILDPPGQLLCSIDYDPDTGRLAITIEPGATLAEILDAISFHLPAVGPPRKDG